MYFFLVTLISAVILLSWLITTCLWCQESRCGTGYGSSPVTLLIIKTCFKLKIKCSISLYNFLWFPDDCWPCNGANGGYHVPFSISVSRGQNYPSYYRHSGTGSLLFASAGCGLLGKFFSFFCIFTSCQTLVDSSSKLFWFHILNVLRCSVQNLAHFSASLSCVPVLSNNDTNVLQQGYNWLVSLILSEIACYFFISSLSSSSVYKNL